MFLPDTSKTASKPSLAVVAVEAQPVTANCGKILGRGDHVLIGVSPFNPRFTEPYLTRLFCWANTTFNDFNVLIPGEREAALMLEAGGTPATKAARKTRKELNRVVRLINSSLDAAQVLPLGVVVQVSDFADNPTYREMVAASRATYRDYPRFRTACQEMSILAVRSRQRAVAAECTPLTDEQVALATSYIFAEIPFFTNSPALLGVPSSLLAYHRPWPIGDLLFSGDLPIRVDPRQGYVVVQTDEMCGSGREDAA